MSDISTGQAWNTGDTVTAPKMTNIIGLATINSSFITTKNPITNLQNNDNFVIARNDGSWARMTGAALADGLVNAEPNFARIAVGPLQAACPIINGDFQVWQRNTSFTSLGPAAHTKIADKWANDALGAMTGRATISQQSAGITGTSFYPDTEYCCRVTVTTAQASLAAGDAFTVGQYIEQQLARVLYDNPTSVSLLLRSNSTGTFCVSLRNNNGGTPNRSYITDCTITSANVWQRFTFPAIATMPTGSGTWGTSDIDYSYILSVCCGTGSTYQTAAGSWSTGNFVGDSNQTNLFANNGATLDIALVDHELGSIVTPYVWTPFDASLQRSKRYYRKSYDYGTFAGTATTTGQIVVLASTGPSAVLYGNVFYDVPMRAAGTATFYSPNSGTSGKLYNDGVADVTFSSVIQSTTSMSKVTASSNFTSPGAGTFHYQVDSDY